MKMKTTIIIALAVLTAGTFAACTNTSTTTTSDKTTDSVSVTHPDAQAPVQHDTIHDKADTAKTK